MLFRSSLFMGVGCWALWAAARFETRPIVGLPSVILIGLALYAACCRLLKVQELFTALRWLSKLPLFQLFANE